MDPLYIRRSVGQATPEEVKGLRDAANANNIFTSNLTSGTCGFGGTSLLGLSNLAEAAGFYNAEQVRVFEGLGVRSLFLQSIMDSVGCEIPSVRARRSRLEPIANCIPRNTDDEQQQYRVYEAPAP